MRHMPLSRAATYVLALTVGVLATVRADSRIDAGTVEGMWLFDENAGASTRDVSANGRDGQFLDAKWSADGAFGSAVEILGGDTHVAIDGYNGVDGSDPRTTVLWFKGDAAIEHSWVKWGVNVTTNKYYIRSHLAGGECWLRIETAGGQHYGGTNVCDGEWHHLAVAFPPGSSMVKEHLLYVDGVLETQTGGDDIGVDTDTATQQVVIGARLAHHVNAEGFIDEVAIFNVELDEADIRQIMDQGLTGALGVDPRSKIATTWATIKGAR
ncbi:hypothetical protein HN371_23825 [Candidatus Poribacteria bacterium]|jgi:hypothetical protein|nr:hypothetical protein [Candidatus Poribacteria bacterium]MBT5533382.1 hypothetical protein [Candidatus Poribacteria bacterium]MBT5710169.1 hypothetical protein [Candidatus Poribacteria bacterium]MBT7098398.1 hypothetical protein [Candidatus Poribacteria bacterium]MBT7806836.1 hypothetical protein [Candidatus Poribacteria bacterium]